CFAIMLHGSRNPPERTTQSFVPVFRIHRLKHARKNLASSRPHVACEDTELGALMELKMGCIDFYLAMLMTRPPNRRGPKMNRCRFIGGGRFAFLPGNPVKGRDSGQVECHREKNLGGGSHAQRSRSG